MQDDFKSPDGRLAVAFQCNEMRMSHTVCNPRITFDGAILLDLWPSEYFAWDGDGKLDAEGRVVMHLRKYPGDVPGFEVRIDAVARTWEVLAGRCPEELESRLGTGLRRMGEKS